MTLSSTSYRHDDVFPQEHSSGTRIDGAGSKGEWYIIPHAAMGKRQTLHFTAGSKPAKWARYREAWELLRGGEIQGGGEAEFKDAAEVAM